MSFLDKRALRSRSSGMTSITQSLRDHFPLKQLVPPGSKLGERILQIPSVVVNFLKYKGRPLVMKITTKAISCTEVRKIVFASSFLLPFDDYNPCLVSHSMYMTDMFGSSPWKIQ